MPRVDLVDLRRVPTLCRVFFQNYQRKYTTASVDPGDWNSVREDYVSKHAATNTQETSRLHPVSPAADLEPSVVGAGVIGPSVVGAAVVGPSVVGAAVVGPSVVGAAITE